VTIQEIWERFSSRYLTRKTPLELAGAVKNNALHWAVVYDRPDQLHELLIEGRGDPHERNIIGLTPFQLARLMGRTKCMRLLNPEHPKQLARVQGPDDLEPFTLTASQFSKAMGFEYLETLCFPDFDTLLQVAVLTERVVNEGFVEPECQWLGVYHRKEIETSEVAPVVAKWINTQLGYGLYAEESIQSGQLVGEYAGYVRPRPFFQFSMSDYVFRYPTARWLNPTYIIDAEHGGNLMRYINHSDKPNCEAVGVVTGPIMRILLRTTTKVPAGKQLTFDYGPIFWRNRWKLFSFE
jgi:hypothetical protein